ncbi:MAG TPA: TonB-dependent receptor [Asticcacaulis sp.]|nr:TonB-dependent receptor [Asticcacaulis sp.]
MFKTTLFLTCAAGVLSFAAPLAAQAQDTAATVGDATTVTVFGHRAAERKSLEQKKTANNQVEVITANGAGKLPDQNVAETVRRAPGVVAANDQGEGRYVVIRGLDPNLAQVRINGQSSAAPEPENRQVKLDDIPTGLIGGVTVIKNQTADYDANAIAGAVDIKTQNALDHKGSFFSGHVAYGHFDLNGKNPSEADMTFGTRFGQNNNMGLVLSVNDSRRPMRSNNTQGSSNWGLRGGFMTPDDFRIRDYNLERARAGSAAAFDWKPQAGVHLFARVLSSHFSDDETRDQFRIPVPTSGITNQTATSGDFTNQTTTRFVRRRKEVDKILTTSVGGEFNLGQGKLSVALTNSQSEKDDPLRSEWQFTESGVNGHYDTTNFLFNVTPVAAAYDATKYKAKSFNLDIRQAKEDLKQVTADYEVPVSWFGDATFKTGFKLSDRRKTNDRNFWSYKLSTAFLLSAAGPSVSNVSTYFGRYPLGPLVNYDQVTTYAQTNNFLVLDTVGSIPNSLGLDYDVSEKIAAAYAMVTIKAGNWTVIPGVRVEDTKTGYKAKSFVATTSTLTQGFNVFGNKHYTDVFPSLVTRYDLTDSQVVRLSATTAIGRPGYADLAPYTNDDGSGTSVVTHGNPDLKPWRSVNLDAGFEQYIGKSGLFSATLFYKDLDTPIYTVQSGTGNATAMPMNAKSGRDSGIELNAVYQFDMLPAPFDGLGMNVNATFQDAKAKGAPNRTDDVPLFFTSKTTGTAQITYEKYGILARVAYTYRSKYLDTLGGSTATDQYTGDNGQLDAKLSYTLGKNWLVYVEGTNLNNTPWRRFQGTSTQLVENEIYGKTVKVGLAVKY